LKNGIYDLTDLKLSKKHLDNLKKLGKRWSDETETMFSNRNDLEDNFVYVFENNIVAICNVEQYKNEFCYIQLIISIEKGFGAKLIECLKEKFLKIVLQSEISLHNYYTSLGFKQHTKHNISYYWSKNNLSQNEVFEEN